MLKSSKFAPTVLKAFVSATLLHATNAATVLNFDIARGWLVKNPIASLITLSIDAIMGGVARQKSTAILSCAVRDGNLDIALEVHQVRPDPTLLHPVLAS